MKVLVVYFSRDGHTERMAKAIARRCEADLERIRESVRSYIDQFRDRFRQVAFFCAEGDADAQRGFDALTRLCGQRPVATFEVERKGLPPVAHNRGLTDFMDSMRL